MPLNPPAPDSNQERQHRMNASRSGSAALLFVMLLTASTEAGASLRKVPPEQLTGRAAAVVVPGGDYASDPAKKLVLGANWRELWATPIEVPVLDLARFAGGLNPSGQNDDQLSRSLIFRGANRRAYLFVPIDKEPSRQIPPKLRDTAAETVIQDSVSSLNPVAPLMLPVLLDAVGVLHLSPELVILPYDKNRLGRFYDGFAGLPGMLQEWPESTDAAQEGFRGAGKVADTDELFRELRRSSRNSVDARAYLRARLIDILVGDTDRQPDQWLWAAFPVGDRTVWQPVPIRQYHAFARQEGIATPGPEGSRFTGTFPGLRGLSGSAGRLDRQILAGIDRKTWMEESRNVIRKLSDQVIAAAVRQMPPPMYAKAGKQIEQDLASRRDRLEQASASLYRRYAATVSIITSEMPEHAELHRLPDGGLDVALYDQSLSSGLWEAAPFWHRRFTSAETGEVRLYLRGGDNTVDIDGPETDRSIVARIVGGNDRNRFEDHTSREQAASARATIFYGGPNSSLVVDGKPAPMRPFRAAAPGTASGTTRPVQLPEHDSGRAIVADLSTMQFDLSPDFGVLAGWGAIIEQYGFNARPYRYRAEIDGALAFGEGIRYRLRFRDDIRSLFDGASLHLETGISTLDNIKFYGLGNKSQAGQGDLDTSKFEVHANVRRIAATLRTPPPFEQAQYWEAGIESTWIDTSPAYDSFFTLHRAEVPGAGTGFTSCLLIGLHRDTRDSGPELQLAPRYSSGRLAGPARPLPNSTALSGMAFDVEARYYPVFMGNHAEFGTIRAELRDYLPLDASRISRIALRIGGQKNWGDYPYFESASIGGGNSVRGFDLRRFSGDASAYGTVELRLYGGKTKLLVPILYGPLLFVDTGRVFVDGESSGNWHTGVGGGIWIAFFEPRYSAHLAVARGLDNGRLDGAVALYAQLGFSF